MPRDVQFILVAMLGLIVGAVAVPTLYYQDRAEPSVSDEALRRLKTQETLGYEIHPLFLQVAGARMTGPTPDHVEGTVVWRTLFGVDVGQRYDLDVGRWLAVWTAFLLAEFALGAYAVRRMVAAGSL